MKPIANNPHEQLELIDINKPVQIYRNLHRGMFSVKQGVVRFHTNLIALRGGCEFIVKEKGRLRVLAEKQKNVHGFVKGYVWPDFTRYLMMIGQKTDFFTNFRTAYYNPYTCSSFMTGEYPVYTAERIVMVMQERAMIYFE